MSILSTNKKIIKVQGTEYSAGEGIIIEDNVISVDMSAVGPNYSAGPNIDIYKEDEQSYISGRDWTDLIKEASANAYDSATGAIPEPQDLTYMSGAIDYVSGEVSNASSYSYSQATGYYNTWITGQYEGDITNITNNISDLSSSLSDNYYKKTETSSKGEIDDALQYISANAGKTYEGISPIVVNNTEDKISAVTWVLSGGNNVTLVDDNINKVTRIDVEVPTPFDPTYMSGAIDNKLDSSSFVPSDFYPMTGNPSGFLTEHQSLAGYATEQWVEDKGYITGVNIPESANWNEATTSYQSNSASYLTAINIPESATWNEVSTSVQTNSAQWSDNTGDEEVNEFVYNNSATINEVNTSYQTNSGTFLTAVDLTPYQTISGMIDYQTTAGMVDYAKTSAVHDYVNNSVSGKLDTSSFSDVSGNFLVASSLNGYATESFVGTVSSDITALIPDTSNFITNLSAETTYQTIEGMTAYQPTGAYITKNDLHFIEV